MAGGADVFTAWASEPFLPSHLEGNGAPTEPAMRIAVALEYIAAQLGEICRKMDGIGSGFGGTKEDFEAMNELLKKL